MHSLKSSFKSKKFKSIFKAALWATLIGALSGIGFGIFVLWQGARFEDLRYLEDYKPKVYTRVYDTRGVLLDIISSEKRIILDFEDIPKDFVNAMIAVEDEYFFQHIGVSPFGIISALKDRVVTGRMRGASTLTQQLVKIITHDARPSYVRKLKEQFLAVQLESRLTKKEIFALYANEVAFDNNQFGIEAAAKHYFGKSVGSLNLVECASLAGIPQAPNRFNPYRNPEACKRKRNIVLHRMLQEGYISRQEYEVAIKQPMELAGRKRGKSRPVAGHFIDKVRTYLFDKYGEEKVRTAGWYVYTTLDFKYQEIAERSLRQELQKVDKSLRYRPADCPSVFKGPNGEKPDILESYFDPSWRAPIQEGINVSGVVMKVTDDYIVVRIEDKLARLDADSMRWLASKNKKTGKYQVSGMAKKFKVGDVPLFKVLEPIPVAPVMPEQPEILGPAVAELAVETDEITDGTTAGESEALPDDITPEQMFSHKLELNQVPDIEAAFVVMDAGTGHILSMVGGYDFNTSKFNRAEQAKRQVGSAIKPLVFGAALEQGYTLSDMLFDEPTNFWDPTQFYFDDDGEFQVLTTSREQARRLKYGVIPKPKPYQPRNYGRTYLGRTTLRNALAQSKNIVAVKLLNQVGYDNVIEYANRFKVAQDLTPFPSMALGAPEISLLDMVSVYGTYARNGVRAEPMFIRLIMDDKGLAIEDNKTKKEQVVPEQNAYLVTNALKSVIFSPHGTAKGARRLGLKHLAGKTGTTNDYTNAWFIGYNHQLVGGAWVGRDLNEKIGRNATGGGTALPIWLSFMEGIKDDLVDEPFPVPEGLVWVPVDPDTGKQITSDCDCKVEKPLLEIFIKGTEPTEICSEKERQRMKLPWYLQKRTYKRDPETSGILPAWQRINYESQLRANQFLRGLAAEK